MRCRNLAPETFASPGEPINPNESDNPLTPARPISDYQTMFSLSQLARELANGTPGQCEHWLGALYLRVMRCVSSELRGGLLKPIDV
ncbi:hypothetical protein MLH93_22620 [Escherichia coli]|jgi:hypothetical protein|uniref:hypothetical protein n=1 Tax=Enterobacteriaceae TaxID=543 RepID=UPI00124EA24F|nr:hypothetical protein [Citrobacter koseri]EDC7434601.1 hypothetical protein [Salmonella enterica subsp. enterica serovar Enteritidis]EDZ9376468.1 hypothetical protein [Salmonella enterica]EES2272607.1 hypothetical protein [Escherichia coli]EFN6682829.1 hypothetical protein [Escherichia coli O179:H8]MDU0857459.1 hypothetical protein [Enterobacter asburiae]HDU4606858.1 hypothetical protein [Klebsiella aerogenes]